ncbi:MAG: hypothetical protein IT428_25655 [Planctomycetaceae bacterium]|nr:hypothetical protein [Planctomycetaceae bacterium]
MLTPYIPHLLALSANSPYWHSADTGLSSCRAALYNLLLHAGLPPLLRRLAGVLQLLRRHGGLQSHAFVQGRVLGHPASAGPGNRRVPHL